MPTNIKLRMSPKKGKRKYLYRSMIGNLLYLKASRPNIVFSVGACARYQACPKEAYLIVLKCIIKYIASTLELGISNPFDIHYDITCYSDTYWARNFDD